LLALAGTIKMLGKMGMGENCIGHVANQRALQKLFKCGDVETHTIETGTSDSLRKQYTLRRQEFR